MSIKPQRPPNSSAHYRRCVVLRDTPDHTAEKAMDCVEQLSPEQVLWISQSEAPGALEATPLTAVKRKLGQSFDAVVLDVHDGFDADILGQAHGFIWGGGALVLRMPPEGEVPEAGQIRMAIHPYGEADVGHRMYRRFEKALSRSHLSPPVPLMPKARSVRGTEEQTYAVQRLVERFHADEPTMSVLLSDRGRGKSSALGQALVQCTELSIAVSAAHIQQAAEVFRFASNIAQPSESNAPCFMDLESLAFGDEQFDVIVIDEAAHISIHLLQQIVQRHPDAHMAFATTARGYEGTGRGFVLRFLEWLAMQSRPLEKLTMNQPIRWAEGDPLERLVFDTLLLDAEPASNLAAFEPDHVQHICLDRDGLADDEKLLREFFGLLVHAHYRTTPGDLHRILDAPNLHMHALTHRGEVVAATMVAEEGGLNDSTIEDLFWGRVRIRGHALPETMVGHLGRKEAAQLKMIRSVRIAVHPEVRRRGLARRLVDEIHKAYDPDLFGTLFGVTPELLQFRRGVGYELIRLGASRGSRTGEPAAVMMRPVSQSAQTLFAQLRADLARDLPLQFNLLESNDDLHLDPRLQAALLKNLPEASDLGTVERDLMVAAFAFGPRTQESVATALMAFVDAYPDHLQALAPEIASLIQHRIGNGVSWEQLMTQHEFPSLSATMRAMRRAFRTFVLQVDPQFPTRYGIPSS